MIDINISKDVLVLGAGAAGLEAAEKIVACGYNVLVLGKGEAKGSDKFEVITHGTLAAFAGVAGDFRAAIAKGGEISERTFGAVVVAPEYQNEPLNEQYGLSLNERVVTQTRMEALLNSKEGEEKLLNKNGSTIAFVTGFGQEGDTESTKRTLESALSVQKLANCKAYIYAGNVKVAADGLERLFTEGRHKGVVCFKPEKMPEITEENGKLKIVAKDPVIRDEVELEPDYIVVEERVSVALDDMNIASVLRIDSDLDCFLPSNNVHRFPVNSNREGIFVVGNFKEAANAALRVKEFIKDGVKQVAEACAVVDDKKCVICLTCYRCCPHGAIFWENGAAVISPVACQACGICASECPMDAIQIGDFTDDDLKRDIKEAVASTGDDTSIVAFCCRNSAFEAGQAALAFGSEFPAGFRMIEVPCAGKVDVEFIMNALVCGADGVIVAACHEGNCKAEKGNLFAKWRVNEIRQRLAAMGLDKERVSFVTVASNMADDFAGKVKAFAEKIKA
ncbi:MAG: hydrogenase iron-sulfur subunit [Thermodesulfobacteriota bacterium]|nr:hydrogenase iron-sulfur subunit [Thermodesulfobacteriota bacterium]